jgi:hypothetical protein
MGLARVKLHGSNLGPAMSALGQKRTSDWRPLMSALPPKADIAGRRLDVRFVPKADSCTAANSRLVDYLVGNNLQRLRYRNAECFRGSLG